MASIARDASQRNGADYLAGHKNTKSFEATHAALTAQAARVELGT